MQVHHLPSLYYPPRKLINIYHVTLIQLVIAQNGLYCIVVNGCYDFMEPRIPVRKLEYS